MILLFKRFVGELFMIKDVTFDIKRQMYIITFRCGATYKTKDYINVKTIIDKKFAA